MYSLEENISLVSDRIREGDLSPYLLGTSKSNLMFVSFGLTKTKTSNIFTSFGTTFDKIATGRYTEDILDRIINMLDENKENLNLLSMRDFRQEVDSFAQRLSQ
jgi:hypothetical protein